MTPQRALSALPESCIKEARERAAEATAIELDFPGWHVWISSLGRWWATRTGPDARHGREDPRPMTVDADDPGGLRAQLASYPEPDRESPDS